MRAVRSRRAVGNLTQPRYAIANSKPESTAGAPTRILDAIGILERSPEIGRPGRTAGTRELVIYGTPYAVPSRASRRAIGPHPHFHGRQEPPEKL